MHKIRWFCCDHCQQVLVTRPLTFIPYLNKYINLLKINAHWLYTYIFANSLKFANSFLTTWRWKSCETVPLILQFYWLTSSVFCLLLSSLSSSSVFSWRALASREAWTKEITWTEHCHHLVLHCPTRWAMFPSFSELLIHCCKLCLKP